MKKTDLILSAVGISISRPASSVTTRLPRMAASAADFIALQPVSSAVPRRRMARAMAKSDPARPPDASLHGCIPDVILLAMFCISFSSISESRS